jgi:hypothetical protein
VLGPRSQSTRRIASSPSVGRGRVGLVMMTDYLRTAS